ncbi:hypothetical protein IFM12275_09220 [Nocardia sputorum]|uniref:Uncharacterized protein n=1 Tax=Nocardia sputorum TaxID=2984338 RepID=A0ABM8CX60_9NOCA|nr:hypothetical protein IFM12275_09220 [Nocardia sputorum]BDT99578.1 hypothetical protein IFM12276_26070 [Nocardia sputorum]
MIGLCDVAASHGERGSGPPGVIRDAGRAVAFGQADRSFAALAQSFGEAEGGLRTAVFVDGRCG